MEMQIIITEADYRNALGPQNANRLNPEKTDVAVLGEERQERVLDALPRVLAHRFRQMIPEDFEIKKIDLKVSLQGTPFGVGVSGEAIVSFGPSE